MITVVSMRHTADSAHSGSAAVVGRLGPADVCDRERSLVVTKGEVEAEIISCRGGGMVDAADLKSAARKGLWVRIPPPAPLSQSYYRVEANAGVFFRREPHKSARLPTLQVATYRRSRVTNRGQPRRTGTPSTARRSGTSLRTYR